MGAGGAQYEVDLLAHGAGAEQEDHDEGMREAHLGAVDGAVACALDDGQQVAVRRVEEDGLDRRPDGLQGGLYFSARMSVMHALVRTPKHGGDPERRQSEEGDGPRHSGRVREDATG